MTVFQFDAKASLARARVGKIRPNRPNRPNQKPDEDHGIGGLGRLGTVTGENQTLPDPDGVARTPAAIEAVWDDALRRAREFRLNNTPPTCAFCGVSDWTVSLSDLDGRKLHVQCWIKSNPFAQ